MKKIKIILLLNLTLLFTACGDLNILTQKADEVFGDQHFKTSIALIELHKIRHGQYPDSLDDLQYIGDWDQMALSAVKYKKNTEGYDLDLTQGWLSVPEKLNYPEEFWQGLGLKNSNMK